MKAFVVLLLAFLSICLVSCNNGSEYLPYSTLVVRNTGGEIVIELKLDNESDWDKVSKCIWLLDGKVLEEKDRSIALSLDKSVSHSIECSLYVGKNLWYSMGSIYSPLDLKEPIETKEIKASEIP